MCKTILLTGATDGIGLATAKMLASKGHHLLIHGRNAEKLMQVENQLKQLPNVGTIECYLADFSDLADVKAMAKKIQSLHTSLDVIINNAGVFKVDQPMTKEGLDVRFVVNTIAPYLLTKQLLPMMGTESRVINLSSAAQSAVEIDALLGNTQLSAMDAYAQSKLAITMWTAHLAKLLGGSGPVIIAVNPGSMLASKMVQEGFGVAGGDINIGANILTKLALEDQFSTHSGDYFDNDSGRFSAPHPDGDNHQKMEQLMTALNVMVQAQ